MDTDSLPGLLTSQSLGASVVAAVFSYLVYQCFFSPLASFPGRLPAKLSKTWRAYTTYRGQWHREMVELHRRHGNVVRIGPNELSVGDPEAFRTIYRAGNAFPKSASYSVLQGSRPFDLTGERNEKIHSAQRRLVARPYTTESIVRLEPQVDELITSLLRKLDACAASSQIVDLGEWFQLFAFDIIGAVSFSKSYGFVSAGSDEGMFARIERAMSSTAWLMYAGWFFRLHQKIIMPVLGNWLAANDRNGYFFQVAKSEVQDRKGKGGDDGDIVGQLSKTQETKPELTDLAISFMMTSNVFAGSDTTSIALRSIFLNLMRHPRALSKLRAELQERRDAGQLSEPTSFEQAEACPYLQAVMYEALRLHSPAGFNLDRDVPENGMVIGGHYVPPGTVVGTSAWVIHRVREVWGEDAEDFRPERWMEADHVSERRRFFFAFGGGTRTCIGRNISWLEMGKLVATLVMRYDFKLADDAKITETAGALVFLKGLRARLSLRMDQ